jgi:hypothetical protein
VDSGRGGSFLGFLFLIEERYNRIVFAPIYSYFHSQGPDCLGDFFFVCTSCIDLRISA